MPILCQKEPGRTYARMHDTWRQRAGAPTLAHRGAAVQLMCGKYEYMGDLIHACAPRRPLERTSCGPPHNRPTMPSEPLLLGRTAHPRAQQHPTSSDKGGLGFGACVAPRPAFGGGVPAKRAAFATAFAPAPWRAVVAAATPGAPAALPEAALLADTTPEAEVAAEPLANTSSCENKAAAGTSARSIEWSSQYSSQHARRTKTRAPLALWCCQLLPSGE